MPATPIEAAVQLPAPFAGRPLVLLGAVLMVVFGLGSIPALWYWARGEASARGVSTAWTLVYMGTGVGALHYAFVRFGRQDRDAPGSLSGRRERLAGTYVASLLVAQVLNTVLTPPDPITQVLTLPPLFVAVFAIAVLLVTRADGERGGESTA